MKEQSTLYNLENFFNNLSLLIKKYFSALMHAKHSKLELPIILFKSFYTILSEVILCDLFESAQRSKTVSSCM